VGLLAGGAALIWDSLRGAAAREARLYARAAATQAARAMDFAQEALNAVGAQSLADLRRRGAEAVAETLTRQADADRDTQWIGLYDPDGRLIATSSPDGPEFAGLVTPLGERVEFARAFYVGLPVYAAWRDKQLIPMSRRLYDADDRLEAVIVMLTTPEFLLALPTGSEPETRIQLRRGDGTVLAGVGPARVDDQAIERAIDHDVLAPGDTGGLAVADDELLVAALPLERYPLIAIAALPAPRLLDGGRPLVVLTLLILAIMAGGAAGFVARGRPEEADSAAPDLETRLLGLLGRRLREPVSTIAQAATALMTEPLSVEQREQVFVLRRAAAALGRAAGDLADWAGPSDPPGEATSFDPAALVAQLAAATGPAARARGLRFEVGGDAGLPASLVGDTARVTQLVAALIDQAIESTEDGTVRLFTGLVGDDGGNITVEITVTDTSRPTDTAREDERRTRLDLARRMAAGLGGTLDITLPPGGGLAVRARLRFVRGGPAAKDDRPARPADGLSILLIEDNSANRQVATGLLGRLGHRIAAAADADAAFALLDEQRFDLVLLDIHLPGRDGISVAATIRGLTGPVARIPIIALTADTMPSTAERCRVAGIDTVLTKPVRQADLAAAITRIAGPRNGAEPVLIDHAGVDELRAALSPDAIGSLLQQLATDIDDTLARLDDATARGLYAEAGRQAHVIKSVAATFALPALSDLAATAEATARALDSGGGTAAAPELRAAALRPIAERSLAALRRALLPAGLHEPLP
jgi:CheY-like chemotaxis protein